MGMRLDIASAVPGRRPGQGLDCLEGGRGWTADLNRAPKSINPHQPSIPSGEHTKNHGKSQFLMGKSTISMAILNYYVSSPEGIHPSQNVRIRNWSASSDRWKRESGPYLSVARGIRQDEVIHGACISAFEKGGGFHCS